MSCIDLRTSDEVRWDPFLYRGRQTPGLREAVISGVSIKLFKNRKRMIFKSNKDDANLFPSTDKKLNKKE